VANPSYAMQHASERMRCSCGVVNCVQVNVKKGAAVVGKNIREIGFRGRFNAAVIAVKRSKVRQPGSLGDLVLQANDVLVISTGSLFDPTNADFTANFEKCVCSKPACEDYSLACMAATCSLMPGMVRKKLLVLLPCLVVSYMPPGLH